MKKQRKLKLEMNKVCISKLNDIKGGNPIESVDICIFTAGPNTIPNEDCKTGITIIENSVGKC